MGTSQSKTAEQKLISSTTAKIKDNDKTTTTTTNDNNGDSESQCPVMQKRQNVNDTTMTKDNDAKNLPRGHPSILKNSADGESKCPMKNADGSFFSLWNKKNKAKVTNTPTDDESTTTETATTTTKASSTPGNNDGTTTAVRYNVYSQPIDPSNQMPAVANQLPAPNQREPLSTERVKSNIPKGGYDDGTTWTYPSPQMFYNALSRKNKLGTTPESDIPSIVALHNNMNESTWTKIIQWEETLGFPSPQLLKFTGRPSDLSPKAMIKHYLFSHPLPYDRHDWTILRSDGSTIRYVIDYYHDETRAREDEESGYPALDDREAVKSLLVDVRPALDSLDGVYGRVKMMGERWLGGNKFEPLPLMPTSEMKSQVEDSLKVWDNIVNNNNNKLSPSSSSVVDDDESTLDRMTDDEAKRLAANFGRWLKDCQDQRRLMSECTSEDDCAKASLGLTVCMAKIFCPLQHDAMTKCLNETTDEADETIDKALETMTLCVGDANDRLGLARRDFPTLFESERA